VVSGGGDGTVRVWDIETGEQLHVLRSPARPVCAVAVSPDGRTIVSGGDRTAQIWDADTGALLHLLEGHTGLVVAVAITPDGRQIVTGGDDVRVWDAETGQLEHVLPGHTGAVRAVAVSPYGREIVTGDHHCLQGWDTTTGARLWALRHPGRVWATAASPDGRHIVAGGDATVRVWDLEGRLVRLLEGHDGVVGAVAISPDGRRIVTADAGHDTDGTVRIWDALTGELVRTLDDLADPLWAVAISPDGHRIVTGGKDGTAKVWDADTGQLLHALTGHTGPVRALAACPDRHQIVTGGKDGTARVWDVRTGQMVRVFDNRPKEVQTVAVSQDGCLVAASSPDTVQVWDTVTGALLRTLDTARPVTAMAFSPDGRTIVAENGPAWVWDVSTGILLYSFKDKGTVMAVSQDGKVLFELLRTNSFSSWVWEMRLCNHDLDESHGGYYYIDAEIGDFPIDEYAIEYQEYDLEYSDEYYHDHYDHCTQVWDDDTGRLVDYIMGLYRDFDFDWLSPLLVSIPGSDDDQTVGVWEPSPSHVRAMERLEAPSSGGLLGTDLYDESACAYAVGISPDARHIVVGTDDQGRRPVAGHAHKTWMAQVFVDTDPQEAFTDPYVGPVSGHARTRVLDGGPKAVNVVTVSPDGQRIVAGNGDGTVQVWDADTGAELYVLDAHDGPVNGVAVLPSPDGVHELVSVGEDGAIRIWDLHTGVWLRGTPLLS